MKRLIAVVLVSLFALSALAENAKTFDATYVATVRDVPSGLTTLDLWIPLPVTRGTQTVSDVVIDAPLEDSGNANPDGDFRYDAVLRGYIFNLSTKGYAAGTYSLSFTVSGDEIVHRLTFVVK